MYVFHDTYQCNPQTCQSHKDPHVHLYKAALPPEAFP